MPSRPPVHRSPLAKPPEAMRLQRNREYDARRAKQLPYRHLYGSAAWKRLRAEFLKAHPVCVMCDPKLPVMARLATHCDHIIPHRGDEALFWSVENLQGLCARHHNRDKQREERGRGVSPF